MNILAKKVSTAVAIVAGAGLWGANAVSLDRKGELDYTPNVATVKGSPYGKVLALAMQGPIDFYWHDGQTHDDAYILKAEKKKNSNNGGEADQAGGGDGGHGHAHHGGEDGDHAHHGHAHEPPKSSKQGVERPWHANAKEKIATLTAYTHRNTNNKRRSKEQVRYLQEATEDKLRFSNDLDPTNYTNYGNYQIFLSNSNVGRYLVDAEQHVTLSRDTLRICKEEPHDPAAWITASMAAYDLAYYMGGKPERYSLDEVRAMLAEFDYCIARYAVLLEEHRVSGRPFSVVKANEMIGQGNFLTKLRDAFDIYMERLSKEREGAAQ